MPVKRRPKVRTEPDRVPQLRRWIDAQASGALSVIADRAEVRLATFYEAARHGLIRADVAKRVADATGGAVSAAELLGLVVAVSRNRRSIGHATSESSEKRATDAEASSNGRAA